MWLRDVSMVLADRVLDCASLRIEDGYIAQIIETTGTSTHTLFPGFVDMHGDMIELELEPRIQVDFPMDVALTHLDARLAASGVTTAYAAVSFSRAANDGERRSFSHTSQIIRALKAAKADMRVDHRIHARFDITYTEAVAALGGLLSEGLVDLVSVMDHTPGQGQYRNLERHIELRADHHGISLEEARQMVQAKIDAATPEEEVLSTLRTVSDLCAHHRLALASHDDDTPQKGALMADLGAVISEFPVTLEAAQTVVARGMMTAMGAPNAMRGQSYSGNLSARAAHSAGLLHILASDYHPAAILPAIRALANQDADGLSGACRLASVNPAKALGLLDRGEIAVGKRADLALFDGRDRCALTLRAGLPIFSNGTVEPASSTISAVA
ncbi:MAG: alpha-D-ribose 1-methylphosphonate 5-triphosphate diphosphatase [Pseudomonadota bacterium]